MLGKNLQLAASNGEVTGEAIYTITGSGTAPETYTWVCPPGVYSVSFVLIGGGGAGHMSNATAGGTSQFDIYKAYGGNASGGGGYWDKNPDNVLIGRTLEGYGGLGNWPSGQYAGGSGGQNGPAGYAATYTSDGTSFGALAANFATTPGGQGTNLYGGTNTYTGSLNGGEYGGGGGAQKDPNYTGGGRLGAGGAGGLVYKNNHSVTPGSSYTVVVGNGGRGQYGGDGGHGAVRIIWPGNTRSFPSINVL